MAAKKTIARSRATKPADDAQPLDLSALTSIVGYPLRRAQLAVFEDFTRRFAALKLSPAQYSALVVIGANPGRKQSDIAGALGIQRPNFVAMMDELERRGLAERLRNAVDRRSRALALTAAGVALAARARRIQAEQEREVERLIGREGREQLIAALARLSDLAT
jgi:DNA-binding MarR family transcriptional regulator